MKRKILGWTAATLAVAGLAAASAPVDAHVIGGIRWSVMTVHPSDAVPGLGR